MRVHGHQMALITSDCDAVQEVGKFCGTEGQKTIDGFTTWNDIEPSLCAAYRSNCIADKGLDISMGWGYSLVLPTKNALGWPADEKIGKVRNTHSTWTCLPTRWP